MTEVSPKFRTKVLVLTEMIKQITRFIFKSNDPLIIFEKVNHSAIQDLDYADTSIVKKRYISSLKSYSTRQLKHLAVVKDTLQFISRNFNSGNKLKIRGKILDVGCGSGIYERIFSNKQNPFKNLKYFGTEINDELVGLCRSSYLNRIFFKSYAHKINSNNEEFEIVFCSSVLHYSLKNWKKSIAELSRVSRKYILLTRHPVTKYQKSFYVNQKVKSIAGIEHHNFIVTNRDELEAEFKKNNLVVIDKDYTQETYNIKGVDEKIVLVQYLLKKSC